MQVHIDIPANIPNVGQGSEDKALKKACRDFETIFNDMLFKAMRKSVAKNDFFGSSKEEELFTDMLDSKIAEEASKNSALGIADMLYRQLSVNTKIDSMDKKVTEND